METIAFSETAMCEKKISSSLFWREFSSEDCNKMCDNCKNPKEKIEGKKVY